MRAKLIVEGKEFDIDIFDPELEKLVKPEKKTGYERLGQGETFFYQHSDGAMLYGYDHHNDNTNNYFNSANYYSDQTVAKNNARADKLMRQLRRFAVEHRKNKISWNDRDHQWFISYNYDNERLEAEFDNYRRIFGNIYFCDRKDVELAIEAFHDELIWYFTEYKDSL